MFLRPKSKIKSSLIETRCSLSTCTFVYVCLSLFICLCICIVVYVFIHSVMSVLSYLAFWYVSLSLSILFSLCIVFLFYVFLCYFIASVGSLFKTVFFCSFLFLDLLSLSVVLCLFKFAFVYRRYLYVVYLVQFFCVCHRLIPSFRRSFLPIVQVCAL